MISYFLEPFDNFNCYRATENPCHLQNHEGLMSRASHSGTSTWDHNLEAIHYHFHFRWSSIKPDGPLCSMWKILKTWCERWSHFAILRNRRGWERWRTGLSKMRFVFFKIIKQLRQKDKILQLKGTKFVRRAPGFLQRDSTHSWVMFFTLRVGQVKEGLLCSGWSRS